MEWEREGEGERERYYKHVGTRSPELNRIEIGLEITKKKHKLIWLFKSDELKRKEKEERRKNLLLSRKVEKERKNRDE